MKKLFTSLCVVALATSMGSVAQAQDSPALEGSNYHVIYLDADTEYEYGINEKIVQDLRPTALEEARPLYIWDNTYAAVEATGKGAFGEIGGYLSLTVNNPEWSGLGFCNLKANGGIGIDYTSITDDYHFHVAVKSTSNRAHQIQVFGGIGNNPAKPEEGDGTNANFSVGIGTFENAPNLTPDFKTDGSWNIVDVPVSQLKELGWSNRAGGFFGNYFVLLSGGGNANIGIDGIFFYLPKGDTGINNPAASSKLNVLVTKNIVEVLNATAPVEVYSISGVKVKESKEAIFGTDELSKGAYIIKSGAAVAKVIIK